MTNADGALLFLWRLKLRGKLRLLGRKAKTPGGAITALVGLLLVGVWVASVVLRSTIVEREGEAPSPSMVRLGLALYLAFVAFSSLSFRGVYLPKPELERLFSGPVDRRAIVRFRMLQAIAMSLPFVLLVAFFLSPRFESASASMGAIALTVPTTAVFGQALSLLAASTKGPLDRLLRRVPPVALRIVGALGIVGVFLTLAFGPGIQTSARADLDRTLKEIAEIRADRGMSARSSEFDVPEPPAPMDRFKAAADHPVVSALTYPLEPWARAITRPTFAQALPWLGLLGLLLVAFFEGVARFPIDFRETSLRTSMDLEARLSRVRRGQGGIGAFRATARARGRGVPWLLGRGPFGALIWMRSSWIVRQARGTLIIAGVVAAGGVYLGTRVFGEDPGDTSVLAILGVVYLSSGLRADFRTDLDRLETIKAWPVASWRIFVATILPCVALTVFVIWFVVLTRATVLGQWNLETALVLGGVPAVAFAWSAIDNGVFLLFPVRFVPGQGSAIQHAGRGFLLVMLRALLLGAGLVLALGGAWLILEFAWAESDAVQIVLVTAWVLAVGASGLASTVAFGAWALRRFDVTRVPGTN